MKTYREGIYGLNRFYVNMYVFTYMKATITNNIRAINLKGDQGCYIGCLEKRKLKGEILQLNYDQKQ